MTRAIRLLALTALLAGMTWAAPPQSFNAVVARAGAALGAKPAHPHLLGFATFFMRTIHPHMAGGLRLALFEPPHAVDLDALATQVLDPGWSRMVREDRRDGERTLIYVRAEGGAFRMLILTRDAGDGQVVLLTLRVRPDQLVEEADRDRRG